MRTDFVDLAKQLATSGRPRIVLPEGEDERILDAALFIQQQNIADVTLLGRTDIIKNKLSKKSSHPETLLISDPKDNPLTEAYSEQLYQLRKHKGLSRTQAKDLTLQPLYFANLMVLAGDAEGCVAGADHPTAEVIRTALQVIGTHKLDNGKTARLSSFFIMHLAKPYLEPVIFADCAINVSPNDEELVEIAYQSAQHAQSLLGLTPKIAMLSFSTHGSASHPSVDKVVAATEQFKKRYPEINIIGDIQFDAAISVDVLRNKWSDSGFQAPANIFIFPNLDAGNIGYKIAERIGGATTIGPIFQGLKKPVNDLSRGADVESIIRTIAVTCLQTVNSS